MPRPKSSGAETQRFRRESKTCDKSQRLSLLKRWASVKAIPRGGGSTSERREKARVCLRPPRDKFGECWACQGWADLVRHHVIQLQNGGEQVGCN
jgi:hypothetical protein